MPRNAPIYHALQIDPSDRKLSQLHTNKGNYIRAHTRTYTHSHTYKCISCGTAGTAFPFSFLCRIITETRLSWSANNVWVGAASNWVAREREREREGRGRGKGRQLLRAKPFIFIHFNWFGIKDNTPVNICDTAEWERGGKREKQKYIVWHRLSKGRGGSSRRAERGVDLKTNSFFGRTCDVPQIVLINFKWTTTEIEKLLKKWGAVAGAKGCRRWYMELRVCAHKFVKLFNFPLSNVFTNQDLLFFFSFQVSENFHNIFNLKIK